MCVDGRDIDAFYCRQCFQNPSPVSPPGFLLDDRVGDLENDLFSFADDKGIHEGRHRGRIEGARAAGDDQRMLSGTLGGPPGNAAHFQHVENIGV
ncbi:MAG: hypothetical protein CSYNP_04500 [Syntrophus sp. SKADARSKE-3]|nr:hypothetical protein [Syntrophus sp. SKADARSKE-3]